MNEKEFLELCRGDLFETICTAGCVNMIKFSKKEALIGALYHHLIHQIKEPLDQ